MRHVPGLLAAACALAACDESLTPPDGAEARQGRETSRREEVVTSLGSIGGPWTIVRFGDFEPNWRSNVGWREAYVHIREDGLSYSIGCNHSGNRARLDEAGILHTETDYPPTLMGCAANAPVSDQEFYRYFRTRPRVTRIGDGRLRLVSGGTELILERPELRRRADPPTWEEIEGRWIPQSFENFSGTGMSGFSMEEPRGVLTISRGQISWSRCAEATISVTYSPTFHLKARSRPKGDCSLSGQPGQDGATRLMRLMRSSPAVKRSGQKTIVLFTDREAVHLEAEQSELAVAGGSAAEQKMLETVGLACNTFKRANCRRLLDGCAPLAAAAHALVGAGYGPAAQDPLILAVVGVGRVLAADADHITADRDGQHGPHCSRSSPGRVEYVGVAAPNPFAPPAIFLFGPPRAQRVAAQAGDFIAAQRTQIGFVKRDLARDLRAFSPPRDRLLQLSRQMSRDSVHAIRIADQTIGVEGPSNFRDAVSEPGNDLRLSLELLPGIDRIPCDALGRVDLISQSGERDHRGLCASDPFIRPELSAALLKLRQCATVVLATLEPVRFADLSGDGARGRDSGE
jgi:hypothetical protein